MDLRLRGYVLIACYQTMDLRAAFSGLFEGFALDVKVNLLRARMSLDNLFTLMILRQMLGLPCRAISLAEPSSLLYSRR